MTEHFENHPAADLFPMMAEDRYAELLASIADHGLIDDITLCEGKILDGRNRYKACVELGVDLTGRFKTHIGDPYEYSWDKNGNRRDLSTDQRAVIWVKINEASEAWQAEREARMAAANQARSEATATQPRSADGTRLAGLPTDCGETRADRDSRAEHQRSSAAAAANASGTNRGAIERAITLCRNRPDLAEAVAQGTMKPTEAHRQMRRDEIGNRVAALPADKFRVIYADPPWQYNDSRAGLGAGVDRAFTAALDHYPTMSKAELAALDIESIAADDAVLFCWATFPLLEDALEVVREWGFRYKTAFVWDKQRGSFGHYHKAEAELLLICTRGSCTPDSDQREKQTQCWPRAEHSRKPDEARTMIDRMYQHGRRIELFARGTVPEGWAAWGNEAQSVEAAE
jgi:N6-adenosine-specific RNA methylase IME4/ParB-like chromosome segregation protein Spo0J